MSKSMNIVCNHMRTIHYKLDIKKTTTSQSAKILASDQMTLGKRGVHALCKRQI